MIGLLSAVLVAVITVGGNYLMNRRNRKDKLEDDKTSEEQKILDEIREIRADVRQIRAEVRSVKQEVEDVANSQKRGTAVECRVRILRFADEISHGKKHTKDHFDQTMQDIRDYEAYCDSDSEFRNGITKASVELINETFAERLRKNDFL